MNPREAERQIAEIRERMARSQDFRGFASLPVAGSGLLALAGAALQGSLAPHPMESLAPYLALWIAIAVLGLSTVSLGLRSWLQRTGSELRGERTMEAVERVAPCMIVGALLTFFLVGGAPQAAWMLPGLWSLIFALGCFASSSLLSREIFWAGAYYVFAGVICLSLGRDAQALAPWQMALAFGGGQLLTAAVLYLTVERTDAT